MSRVINTWIGKDWLNWLYCVSIFVFVVSIISINYLGCVWYNFDMYSDMFVAEKMADSLSVIPQDWIFGNQLYFFATPVLAALFNLVFHNGFISMATASTVMMILVLAAFLWLSKLFFEKKSIIIGKDNSVYLMTLEKSIDSYSTYTYSVEKTDKTFKNVEEVKNEVGIVTSATIEYTDGTKEKL